MSRKIDINNLLSTFENTDQPIGATYLSSIMNIPQTSIGRLLLQLEQDGYLEKVGKKGRIITSKGKAYLKEQKILSIKNDEATKLFDIVENTSKPRLLEILKIRRVLELEAIEECCYSATNDQLLELHNIAMQYEKAISSGQTGNAEDLNFHLTIAKISGNNVLYQLLKILLINNNGYVNLAKNPTHDTNSFWVDHTKIVQAIQSRDKVLAKETMLKHINSIIEHIDD